MRVAGLKVLGTTAELPRVLDEVQPDEVIIAIPSAPGTLRQKVVTACRERGIPVRTLPTIFELLVRRREPDAPGARGAGRGRARPRAGARGDRPRRRATWRPRRCSSPAPAARSAPSCAARSRAWARSGWCWSRTPRTPCSRSAASSRRSATSRSAVAVLADCKDATRMREVFARAPPVGRLPRGRVQARAADGGEPGRGGPQQRGGHAHRRRRGRRGGRRARSCWSRPTRP